MHKLAESLSPIERTVLPLIKRNPSLKELVKSGLKEIEIIRAFQWLENKGLIKTKKEDREFVDLDSNGREALTKGLPEKRFLKCILNEDLPLKEIKSRCNLDDNEVNVAFGTLKRNSCIILGEKIKITPSGKEYLNNSRIEDFLKELPEEKTKLNKDILQELKSRRLMIKDNLVRDIIVKLTDSGEKISRLNLNTDMIESLNINVLRNKAWKNKKFRRYDIKINVPKVYPGKKHFVNEALDYAKRIWLEMGFKEMKGNIIQPAFWNMDALFVPQDHPARDEQDTFYLDGKLKSLPKIASKIREAHENGGNTGSKGWGYNWNEDEAKRLLLRTHTSVLSAQTLSILKNSDLPGKYFSVGKCFRNETLDYSHLFEFNQTEGMVIDENANLRHLMGYLREFANKMGFPKVRFRPAYFPYTEPSMEGDVYDPVRGKWIEFIGAGIFRPEVVKPLLGKDVPVLAWGPGIDRIITSAYQIKDIRELYKNDLKQLREAKLWLK
ncbi:phenylalanine--tRNA ligase subunit alpha [Candidatus Woesearchaeota archaeon]|nr:phenylalanine--tRNA ligase subunit alpha [Candidatus Woesearchaeota archaeon]